MRTVSFIFFTFLLSDLSGQNFKLEKSGIFIPQNKKVFLLNDSVTQKKVITFRTILNVNTDGTPISYHPNDLEGKTLAINTILNAVAIYKNGSSVNLCLQKGEMKKEALALFEKFRDWHYDSFPSGYHITWKNVLIPDSSSGKVKPCIFQTGKYAGYYGSSTSLKNAVRDKGECACNDQVNPLEVPGFVLVGGENNILRTYGAEKGDLVIAYNPANGNLVYAIINDTGPKKTLGEGTVLLNMKLKGQTNFPTNISESYRLATGNKVTMLIIPHSSTYERIKPYTEENINSRITRWMQQVGFQTNDEIKTFLISLSSLE